MIAALPLTTLATLDHAWRVVCIQDAELRDWQGDLYDERVRRRWTWMLARGLVVTVTQRDTAGRVQVLGKIAAHVSPESAHEAAALGDSRSATAVVLAAQRSAQQSASMKAYWERRRNAAQ